MELHSKKTGTIIMEIAVKFMIVGWGTDGYNSTLKLASWIPPKNSKIRAILTEMKNAF
jgi:hypothetical protein